MCLFFFRIMYVYLDCYQLRNTLVIMYLPYSQIDFQSTIIKLQVKVMSEKRNQFLKSNELL